MDFIGAILLHISLDFITGLPPFCGKTVILSIMDRCQALGATASLSSGYHSQTNGQMERVSQDLEAALLCVCLHCPTSWSTHLPWLGTAKWRFHLLLLHLRWADHVWKETRIALSCTVSRNKQVVD